MTQNHQEKNINCEKLNAAWRAATSCVTSWLALRVLDQRQKYLYLQPIVGIVNEPFNHGHNSTRTRKGLVLHLVDSTIS